MESVMNLTLSEAVGRIALIVVALSAVIQFSPIKFNPWSWLGKTIGRAINKEMMDRMDQFETKVDRLEFSMEKAAAINNRTKIIRFASEIRTKQKHSKDYFDEVMSAITEYDLYCDDHPDFRNNITRASSKLIEETYQECLRDNTFL